MEFVSDGSIYSDAFENQLLTHEQLNQYYPAWFRDFSEFDNKITCTIAAESVVVTRWTFTGTHNSLLGAPVIAQSTRWEGEFDWDDRKD